MISSTTHTYSNSVSLKPGKRRVVVIMIYVRKQPLIKHWLKRWKTEMTEECSDLYLRMFHCFDWYLRIFDWCDPYWESLIDTRECLIDLIDTWECFIDLITTENVWLISLIPVSVWLILLIPVNVIWLIAQNDWFIWFIPENVLFNRYWEHLIDLIDTWECLDTQWRRMFSTLMVAALLIALSRFLLSSAALFSEGPDIHDSHSEDKPSTIYNWASDIFMGFHPAP